jgi:hypothetical protein
VGATDLEAVFNTANADPLTDVVVGTNGNQAEFELLSSQADESCSANVPCQDVGDAEKVEERTHAEHGQENNTDLLSDDATIPIPATDAPASTVILLSVTTPILGDSGPAFEGNMQSATVIPTAATSEDALTTTTDNAITTTTDNAVPSTTDNDVPSTTDADASITTAA